ncbi:MAG: alpha/beta hydrolase domain-containing protein [Gemmataceae bacterium]
MFTRVRLGLLLAVWLIPGLAARAEVIDFKIERREPFAGGMAFGDVGPYEKITGVVRFAVDPGNPRNQIIVDLQNAPRNKAGKVEFESDFFILAPKDPSKGNGAILYDVNNRGNKLALAMFNQAPGNNDPAEARDAGNGFLFRKGYTIVWCGWIGELLPGGNRLLMRPPVATLDGKPIRGLVRQEMVTEEPAKELPLSRRPNHGSYRPAPNGLDKATLTWRMRETDPRILIPREQWELVSAEIPTTKQGVAGTLPPIQLRPAGGFRPGYIYELIYEAEGPIVQGLGFAATRDLVSFLKYDGDKNPLAVNGASAIKRAHGFGVSQSGRFLRTFLYLGFNADEKNRKVFDGLIPHVAGGGLGYFNFRFAQPNRHNGQHEDHSFPADFFPFTYGPSQEAYLWAGDGQVVNTGRTDSIQQRLMNDEGGKFLPKVMHTQSAAEYWHRAGSLVHTDPLGKKDADVPANVRIYAFGGTQHGPASFPPSRRFAQNLTNPGDYKPFLRALLESLDQWTRDGTEPPASVYPRIDKGTLVAWGQASTGFPALPGVRYPEVIQRAQSFDHGPDCWTKGIMTVLPPRRQGEFVVLVPRSGPDGNDLGTLLPAEVGVPLATFTGWNLRQRDVGAEDMLASLMGSYIPFATTKAARQTTGDPRPSIEERYGSFARYQEKFDANCADLVKQRYLLQEDADRLIAGRAAFRKLFEK